jgi:hypothetical protein
MEQNERYIRAEEVSARILDDLTDAHEAGELSSSQLRRKTTYRQVIRAINHADRIVCRDLNVERYIVFYIPANTNNIPFDSNEQFSGKILEELRSKSLENPNRSYFYNKFDYLNVLDINDRYIHIYKEYPVSSEQSDAKIRLVNTSEFFNTKDYLDGSEYSFNPFGEPYDTDIDIRFQASFIPDENRLILGGGYTTPVFARCMARIMPGIFNVSSVPDARAQSCEFDDYKVVAPQYTFEHLLSEAILYLLPKTPTATRRHMERMREREKSNTAKAKPVERSVITPPFSWG